MLSVSTKVTPTSISISTFITYSLYSNIFRGKVLYEFPLLYSLYVQLLQVYLRGFQIISIYVYLDRLRQQKDG